jgi:geranylgeranyl pyrophosphate synthase
VYVTNCRQWLNVPDDTLRHIKGIIRKLHNASLLIDDIEDSSTMRRGQPVAHAIYGVPLTINCGNLYVPHADHVTSPFCLCSVSVMLNMYF